MQSRYEGRFLNQLNLGAAYTWSKALDNATEIFDFGFDRSFSQHPLDITEGERGYSGFDRRHVLSINGIWDVPWFREQRGLLGRVFGGWQVSGIYILSSGQRYTPRQGFNIDSYLENSFNLRPFSGNPNADRTAVGITALDAALQFLAPLPAGQDPNALYSLNELNRTGNVVRVSSDDVRYIFNGPGAALLFGTPLGDVIRNSAVGPKINNLNTGFFKNTTVSEGVRVQFRTEIFNLLNHPNPGYGAFFVGDSVPITTVDFAGIGFNDFKQLDSNRRIIQFGLRFIF
jgi:hypothetical protein